MSLTIESDIEMILPFSTEPESEELEEVILELPSVGSLPVSSDTTLKMDSYDEDVNANPFFQSFTATCPDLFSQCVEEQWLICVPRRDSLPKYAFTLEDFSHHILRPISKSHHHHHQYLSPPDGRHKRHFSGDSDGLSSCISNNGDADGSFLSSRSGSSCGAHQDAASSVSSTDENNFSFTLSSPSINTTFLSTIAAGTSPQNISGSRNFLKGNWNYRTLSHVNVEYSGTTLILDIEVPTTDKPLNSDKKGMKRAADHLSSPGASTAVNMDESGISLPTDDDDSFLSSKMEDTHSSSSPQPSTDSAKAVHRVQLRKEVLFEETFYTNNRQKYKVLCVASPLNSKVDMEDENFGNSGLGLWNLTSLRDCIDFLWVKGNPNILTTFDINIKLFQHNHRGLENFPLKVQKDLVNTLYLKCLNHAITNGGIVSCNQEKTPENHQALNEFLLQRLKLATETYILNGIYRGLISAITSFVSAEDARLNKVMRNLTELHPQDLDINNIHWDNLTRARQELGRLNTYSSPLGKLTCMKRTLRYLRPEPFPEAMEAFPLTADELIPIWVYLVVKNPLGNWTAQLEFLRHFRFSIESSSHHQSGKAKDNENSFYITTLEASLEHLRSGKVLGITDNDQRVDVGMPCDLGEAWLHSVHSKALDSPLGEMFDVIRLGNCPRLEELIESYEKERKKNIPEEEENEFLSSPKRSSKPIDFQELCHPLCQCENCMKAIIKNLKEMEKAEEELSVPAVNLKSASEGLTMLHVACIYGRPKIVEFLIDVGANLEAQDVDGMTALHFAASRGHQNALLLLLDAGAFLEPRNCVLNTPLHLAAQNGHEGCVKALIYDAEQRGRKLHLSARNQKGDTPLHFASRWGFQGIAQILVEHGAAIKIHNIRHVTPLDCAHDIHIQKILQRSLRRRSLVEVNHGDFINIEMVQKEETGGIVMLISEPKEAIHSPVREGNENISKNMKSQEVNVNNQKNRSESNSRNTSRNTSRVSSRRVSTVASAVAAATVASGFPELITPSMTMLSSSSPGSLLSLPRSRKTSSIINPMKGIDEESTRTLLKGVAEHLQHENENQSNENGQYVSDANSYLSVVGNNNNGDGGDSDYLRKVSVQSLEDCRMASAESAFTGLMPSEDTKERDIKKIFSAIHQSDFPLALFYLGIPAEELSNPENDLGDGIAIEKIPSCHPLCRCSRCVAKNAGLGLGLNVKNLEGRTPLHVVTEKGLNKLVKVLIRFGADVNCQSTHDKKTPLDIAKEMGMHEVEDTLVACGGTSTTSFALEQQKEFWGTE